jgi:hypothetical protein
MEGQTTQGPKEEGQTTQWPKEEGQTTNPIVGKPRTLSHSLVIHVH